MCFLMLLGILNGVGIGKSPARPNRAEQSKQRLLIRIFICFGLTITIEFWLRYGYY